jgi:hypothetical protein
MEEAMMLRSTNRLISTLISFLILFSSVVSIHSAAADQATSYMNANFSGNAYLSSTRSLEYDVTPLANGSDTWRYLNWSWADANQPRYGGAQVGIDYFNNGTAHNFVLSIDNATDIQLLTGAGNAVSCDKRNPIEASGKTYFQAVCWSNYNVALGHPYRIKVFNDSARGSTWFKATFDDLVSGAHLEIGSINAGERNFQQPLRYTQFGMGELTNSTSCSSVGINDTIVSSLRNDGTTLSNFSTQSLGSCINGVIVPNKYPLGGQVFKFGGTNPASRNLEAKTYNPDEKSTTLRVKRSINQVPHPGNIFPGLVQTRYDGYFNDNPAFFVKPVTSGDYKVIDTLPEYQLSEGQKPVFSNLWTGFFIPDTSGSWNFRMTSDDAAYFWIGNDAVLNYSQNISTANIALPGTHPAGTRDVNINLEKDKIYPFRIFYGNALDVAVFKFEYQAPNSNQFETDLQSLVWYANPSACSNWGIDYIISGDLGYTKASLPQGCSSKYADSSSGPSANNSRPAKPTFSLVNFADNKINISVNLGSLESLPDKIYLIAPKLGAIEASKLQGKIAGTFATWSLSVSEVLAGTSIPLKVVSVKNGIESEALEGIFDAPSAISKTIMSKSVPLPAKNIKSRIIGTSAFISAESTIKVGAIATAAYVFGSSIGVSKAKAIAGDIVGSKILLEVPIKQSMAGKKIVINLFLANDAGESQPSQVVIDVPSIPGASFAMPTKPKVPNTVFCTKGTISRTFAATSCPPGWKK